MGHRFCAQLFIICFALGGASCSPQSEIGPRKEILMPIQTGSTLHRRIVVAAESGNVTKTSKKKKKESKRKEPKKEASKGKSPKPSPTPESKRPAPMEENVPPPERFR